MRHRFPISRTIPGELTLADHAEAWTRKQGQPVPPRKTPAWQAMYEAWHAYAFAGFAKPVSP